MKNIDLNSEEFINNPYPAYEMLRKAGPYWLEHKQTYSHSQGIWLISRYKDVSDVLKESVAISKRVLNVRPAENISPLDHNMLNQDPPDHTRLRNLVNKAFAPEQIKKLTLRIENIVADLISKMLAKSEGDFVKDFAGQLPMILIADFMGVPLQDHIMFCRWSSDILCGYDAGVESPDNFRSYKTALKEMEDYFAKLIEERRLKPSTDLISTLIEAHDKHDQLTNTELVSMCMLLLISGHETTTNMLSSGMHTLLRHPEQFDLLKKNPEYMPSAIEEILRFESPIQRATFRITTADYELGSKKFSPGEQLVAIIGAANRDPEYFEAPERFDITRTPNRHLSFGFGVHFCLGSFLARAEARISFSRIIERMPDIEMGSYAPKWNDKKLFRGLQSLPIIIGSSNADKKTNRG